MFKRFTVLVCFFTLSICSANAQWEIYNTENSELESNRIKDLLVDYDNNVWINHEDKITMYDGNSWQVYNTENSLLSDSINSFHLDYEGDVWAIGKGIFKFNSISSKWDVIDKNISGERLIVDKDKNIYLSSYVYLFKHSNDKIDTVFNGREDDFGSPTEVSTMITDFEGNIWFGTFGWPNGLNNVLSDTILNFSKENSELPNENIRSMTLDSNNNIWLTTQARLNLIKFDHINNNWSIFNNKNSSINDTVGNIVSRDIAVDKSNNIWFIRNFLGANEPTLFNYSYKNWNKFKLDSIFGFSDDEFVPLTSIAVDMDNNIWIGTYDKGLIKYTRNPNSVENLTNEEFNIYPNPASNFLTVNLNNENIIKEFRIFDYKGVELLSGRADKSSINIDISKLHSGFYILEITKNSGKKVREKFIKE